MLFLSLALQLMPCNVYFWIDRRGHIEGLGNRWQPHIWKTFSRWVESVKMLMPALHHRAQNHLEAWLSLRDEEYRCEFWAALALTITFCCSKFFLKFQLDTIHISLENAFIVLLAMLATMFSLQKDCISGVFFKVLECFVKKEKKKKSFNL